MMGLLSMGLGCILFLINSAVLLPVAHPKGILCALFENASIPVRTPVSHFGELKEPGKIYCRESNCCMGIWSVSDGNFQPVLLSCFPSSAVCRSTHCTPVVKQSMYHCLCSSDMCNANITFLHQQIPAAQAEPEGCAHWNQSCDWAATARERPWNASGFTIRKLKRGCLLIRKENALEHQELLTQEKDTPPSLPVDGLILLQVLREDTLAAHLWTGVLHGRNVFIKSFPPPLKELYRHEWRILSLLAPLQHKNIICLLAAGSGTGGSLEDHQFLVLQHYPEGSLRNYLTNHTPDWTTACRMAISLTRGLAFLHTYISEDTYKPVIAHRDLNSDNVLVTEDSSCIISDFGLSVVLEGCRTKNKNIQDPTMIFMAGTLRYMSPEMLDGFLNLKSVERALTQADVYSLGLLLWEIFIRCNDLYEDRQAPDYQVVFLKELGPNPTLDELRLLVVENKGRPQHSKPWRKNTQLSMALWETLEDCWDPDSEARLTAQCAEWRLSNLSSAHP
ncbi:anti-Muellerian hormone type-2 receptor [Pelobates fuscus]|uniref:anti-Muellerian hormone type-2 receptor n=1 Tax=Pelobates fuscus TaxID=191477 RepID=UPI002FE4A201